MSNKDLVFRIKNYKQPNAQLKLNPEGLGLMKRMESLRATKGDNVNPFDYCNDAETAFIHAIHSAQMAIGAAAEGRDKMDAGCDPVIPEAGSDTPKLTLVEGSNLSATEVAEHHRSNTPTTIVEE
jgi:hypothetical protein